MPRRNYPASARPPQRRTPPDIAPTPHLVCRQKRRFATEAMARRQADTQELVSPGVNITVYQCDYCHKWHLTSRPSHP
ncbi:MAG: hypothetical protein Q4F02_03310 [Candidatus Saccharibacteria bacterium]|nr:hypothetical protein [Candidatus Saccharibacteria bacterium]